MELVDQGICLECTRELMDASSRHFRYPFIHCNQCGPRFSILENLPPTRANSSLRSFPVCSDCQAEQHDPDSRRYRMETIICPQCGPQVWLERGHPEAPKIEARGEAAFLKAQRILAQGKLLAIKGYADFYLICDGTNSEAASMLRQVLDILDKPLQILVPDLETAEELCNLERPERDALESAVRPVVIINNRTDSALLNAAAPFLKTIGIHLPNSGLERLLFLEKEKKRFQFGGQVRPPPGLLAAKAPLSADAIRSLGSQVGGLLMHDLEWQVRMQDTVVRIYTGTQIRQDAQADNLCVGKQAHLLQLGRGCVPLPVRLPFTVPNVLAGGDDRRNTSCHIQASTAWISSENGDLKQLENLAHFEEEILHIENLNGFKPEILAYDRDSKSSASRYILERARRDKIPAQAIQHHHAQIVACMAENSLRKEATVLGIAFDSGGLGQNAEQAKPVVWGGEFLVAGYLDYQRPYHMAYMPLPGGEAAAGNLARIALAYLWEAKIPWEIDIPSVSAVCAQENSLLRSMLKHNLNTPPHSSMGKLFEAVASLAGLRQEISYTNQALREMESAADPQESAAYTFEVRRTWDGKQEIDPLPVIRAVVEDVRSRVSLKIISARFHNGVAKLVFDICTEMRTHSHINRVALSGEVWQNMLLLERTTHLLNRGGFEVYTHHLTPSTSACVSLGQAVIAGCRAVAGRGA
jgi:hydrogenase maturation protein HypF